MKSHKGEPETQENTCDYCGRRLGSSRVMAGGSDANRHFCSLVCYDGWRLEKQDAGAPGDQSRRVRISSGIRCAAQQIWGADVADGSFASVLSCSAHVRFTLDSDRLADIPNRPFCAKSGHLLDLGAIVVSVLLGLAAMVGLAAHFAVPGHDDEDYEGHDPMRTMPADGKIA